MNTSFPRPVAAAMLAAFVAVGIFAQTQSPAERERSRERNRDALIQLIGEIADRPDSPEENDIKAVVIDGEFDDWPEGASAMYDGRYLYLRFDRSEMGKLYTPGETIRVLIDADAEPASGEPSTGLPGDQLGADLVIELSTEETRRGSRPSLVVTHHAGETSELAMDQLRPVVSPSHAFPIHELRIALPDSVRITQQAPAAMIVRTAEGTQTKRFPVKRLPSAHADVVLPPAIPNKEEGSIRLVSHNVLWSSPEENPEPFSRMYKAIDADIYLIQEWGRDEPTEDHYETLLADWFAQHVDDSVEWSVARGPAWGVAVVSKHPILIALDDELKVEKSNTKWDFPVRFVGAKVLTPEGPFALGSLHLKCCGTLDSEEDLRRLDEAGQINTAMREFAYSGASALAPVVVLAGDFNHNGHPRVTEAALTELDADGSSLRFARTLVLGEKARYTWGGPTRDYQRSTLDYVAFSDAAATITAAFVLDTTVLPAQSLGRWKLRADDSNASDHLPVVVDLDPK